MAGTHHGRSEVSAETASASSESATPAAVGEQRVTAALSPPTATPGHVADAASPAHLGRKWLLWSAIVIGLALGAYLLIPWVKTVLTTISTDDAYVNSHVTFLAARVGGQVASVLVDDNYRVKKGDVLVQLDKEPYQVQVEIRKAAVVTAESNLAAARAQVRGLLA